jgi:hypothetical protein
VSDVGASTGGSAWEYEACPLPGATVLAGPSMPDWCTPLDEPTWMKAGDATLMRDDDAVVGFEAVGERWAIPWWVMKNHHIANLTLGGEAILVTLCEFCAGGGVFDPVVDGRRFRFHVKGWYGQTPLMTDHETGSLWTMVNAQPLHGRALEFGRLPKAPSVHATWREWQTMYPDTWVVHGEGERRDGHGASFTTPDHQVRHEGMNSGSLFGPADARLGDLDLVVGVEINGRSRAYPLSVLHAQDGIVEDVIADCPIAVLTRPGSWVAVVLGREVGGTPVELQWDDQEDPPAHLLDGLSGSRFDLWGTCVSGPHEGARLPYVTSVLKKWTVWTQTNPGSEVWGLEEPTRR